MAKEFSVKNNEELSKIMEHGSYEISKSIVEKIELILSEMQNFINHDIASSYDDIKKNF